MPNYEFKCPDCEVVTTESFSFEKRPLHVECPMCGKRSAKYQISKPGLTKASYLDGTKRFQEAKEAAKLNKQMAGEKNGNTKKEMAAEIKKIGFNFNRDPKGSK